jgi:hypothetical protein
MSRWRHRYALARRPLTSPPAHRQHHDSALAALDWIAEWRRKPSAESRPPGWMQRRSRVGDDAVLVGEGGGGGA